MKKSYQMRIDLKGIRPPIWRRVLVNSDMTLNDLHQVIQACMGWNDCHLHEFEIYDKRYGTPSVNGSFCDDEILDDSKFTLKKILIDACQRFDYTYDFGDDWRHSIRLEKVLPLDSSQHYPICTHGKGVCPPEDCGGTWGYYNLLDVLKDPSHSEFEETKEWLGKDNLGTFDLKKAQKCLQSWMENKETLCS